MLESTLRICRGIAIALICFCLIWAVVYSIVYVLPKALKSSYPDYVPFSYEYWDRGHLELAIAISFMTAWSGTYLLMRTPTLGSQRFGECIKCNYDLRGTPEHEPGHRICPECGHDNSTEDEDH